MAKHLTAPERSEMKRAFATTSLLLLAAGALTACDGVSETTLADTSAVQPATEEPTPTPTVTVTAPAPTPTVTVTAPAPAPVVVPPPARAPAPAPVGTVAQQNALESAHAYLRSGDFSYLRLIEQLEYEKYSYADAVWAVDRSGGNWQQEAIDSAKGYLRSSSFSRQGLIEQLEYEQFTHEQAVNAVNAVGL